MCRLIRLIAILLAVVLLCGCGAETDQVFTCRGLSITLGPEFADYSQKPAGEQLDFLYVSDNIGFTGVCDSKHTFTDMYPNMTLQQYTELTAKSSGISSAVKVYRGIPYYIYTGITDGIEFTYLAAAFESPVSYWLLQCYCKSAEFDRLERMIWEYLETVRLA